MAPIVAPDIVQYSVIQQLGGQPVVNVLHFRVDPADIIGSRDGGLRDVGADILDNWNDHVLSQQCDDLTALRVDYLDLDSLSGPRGSITTTGNTSWPAAGPNATDPVMPAVVALRVDKQASGGRGTKNGRMYLAGISETATDPGVSQSWSAGTIAGVNASLANFLAGVNDDEGLAPIGRHMAIVHTQDGVYVDDSRVQSLSVNSSVSTQVRRGTLR